MRKAVTIVALALSVAGCGGATGPAGGTRPPLAAVPETTEPRYDAFARAVLREDLVAAGAAARDEAAVADARIDARPPALAAAPMPTAVLPPPPPPPPATPPRVAVEENLVTAGGVVGLAEAVLRDRQELERRARLAAPIPAATPSSVHVTTLAFAPGGAELGPLERRRLDAALAQTGRDGQWSVHTGGSLADARGRRVAELLVAAGIEPTDVRIVTAADDVAVAEVRVRR